MDVDVDTGARVRSSDQEEDDEEDEIPPGSQACFAGIGLSLVSRALSQGSPPGSGRKELPTAASPSTRVSNGPAAATIAASLAQEQPSSGLAAMSWAPSVAAALPPASLQMPAVPASRADKTGIEQPGPVPSHSASTPVLPSMQGQTLPGPSAARMSISSKLTWAVGKQPASTPAHNRAAISPLPPPVSARQAVATTFVPGFSAQPPLQGPAISRPASLQTYR